MCQECEKDLPYRRALLETDFGRFNAKLTSSAECDAASQHYVAVMDKYAQVTWLFGFSCSRTLSVCSQI